MENPFLEFIVNFIKYLFENWIAIISLIVSIYTVLKNSVKLDVNFESKSRWIHALLLDDGRSITNDYGLIQTNIRIINTSNTDLSYFDLRVIDMKNNTEITFYNEAQSHPYSEIKNSKVISFLNINNQSESSIGMLSLPQADFGVIKAREVTSIDIVISSEQPLKDFFIVFKVTKRKSIFKKVKVGYINSPYETYSGSVLVDESEKPNYKEFFSSLQSE